MAEKFTSVDDYVAAQPPDVQPILDEVRRRVTATVPGSVEAISYQIPAFKLNGKDLLYVAAWTATSEMGPPPQPTPVPSAAGGGFPSAAAGRDA